MVGESKKIDYTHQQFVKMVNDQPSPMRGVYGPAIIDLAEKGCTIEGMNPYAYAMIKQDYIIDNIDGANNAVLYTFREGLKIDGVDSIQYVMNSNLTLAQKKEKVENAVKYAVDNGKLINNEDPVVYAYKNGLKMDGVDPVQHILDSKLPENQKNQRLIAFLKYAAVYKIKINGKDPVLYAYRNNLKIDNMSAIDYALSHGIKVNNKNFLEFLIDSELTEERQLAINIAVENIMDIHDKHPIQFAIDNKMKIFDKDPIEYILSLQEYGPEYKRKLPVEYLKEYGIRVNGKGIISYLNENDYLLDKVIERYNAELKIIDAKVMYDKIIHRLDIGKEIGKFSAIKAKIHEKTGGLLFKHTVFAEKLRKKIDLMKNTTENEHIAAPTVNPKPKNTNSSVAKPTVNKKQDQIAAIKIPENIQDSLKDVRIYGGGAGNHAIPKAQRIAGRGTSRSPT